MPSPEEMPEPWCQLGYTENQTQQICQWWERSFDEFLQWMFGQTVAVCDGTCYNHETREYEPMCEIPHGTIYYTGDVYRYLNRMPVID